MGKSRTSGLPKTGEGLGMINRSSSTTIKSSTPIGTAISNGAGLYANEIQNARDAMEREYGNVISQANLSVADMGNASALGAYGDGTVYMNQKFVSNRNMTDAMKQAEIDGFHPKIGNKTGAEAVTAHELGHFLADKAMTKAGISERDIVDRASKTLGIKTNNVAGLISGYARYNYAETIAEASADVFCNGKNASKASIAIMGEIKRILK